MERKFEWRDLPELLKSASKQWVSDDVFGKAAAVAYYAVFSLPGLLLVIITIVGVFFDDTATIKEVSSEFENILGQESAEGITKIIMNINVKNQSFLMNLVGIGSLLFGATGLFVQLQDALNSIWEVKKNENAGFFALIKDRVISLGMVLVIGFLLLMSLVISTVISSVENWLANNISETLILLAQGINLVLSLGIATLLFAAIFKILPDVKIKWKMVWLGAITTSILFTVGKTLISLYLSQTDPGATFGAAGAIILILLWVSYSCLIMFFGAEFTQVYGIKYGYNLEPSKIAEYTAEVKLKEKKGLENKKSE